MISLGHFCKKRDGLPGKVYMILLNMHGVERENVKTLVLAEGGSSGKGESSHKDERGHESSHRWTFLPGWKFFRRSKPDFVIVDNIVQQRGFA
jgi:hypothetical protein